MGVSLAQTLLFIVVYLAGLFIVARHWPRANRKGLLAGIIGGLVIWFFAMLLPLLIDYHPQLLTNLYNTLAGASDTLWTTAIMVSLILNTVLFMAVSILTNTGEDEKIAAETRPMDALNHGIIERCTPLQPSSHEQSEDMQLIERDLDSGQFQFTGLAADLDNLRRHHRETLDNLPIGVCSSGDNGELLMWNRSMAQITGIEPRDVLGSLLDAIPQPWRQIIGDFQRSDSSTILKTEVVTAAGGSRWISLHKASPEDDTSRSSGNTVILVEDITDFERLEEELLHNERLASIGRLAAGVAHEIGNPITGIACLAQNLEYETDPQEVRYMAQDILKQTGRVTRIVESLVNFSHAGSSSGQISLAPSNLADCVDEAIHLLTLDQDANSVQFSNHCDRELLVLADSQRLLQVFINLLGNARDACDDSGDDSGKVLISATTDNQQVSIDIQDNGCGIPPELQSRVFEPFYTTKDPGSGTGLGLALVFSIMDDMDGAVHLTSPVAAGANPGTRVNLQLPHTNYGPEFDV